MSEARMGPAQWEDKAAAHQQRGEWAEAAAAWTRAAQTTLGHWRRERYEDAATWCRQRRTTEAESAA